MYIYSIWALNRGHYPYKWLWTYAGDKFFEAEGEIKFSPVTGVCPRPITTYMINLGRAVGLFNKFNSKISKGIDQVANIARNVGQAVQNVKNIG